MVLGTVMHRTGFFPYLAVAIGGGLAAYGVHRAADQVYGYHASVVAPLVFYLALQMAFAAWWRLRRAPHARVAPGVIYALAVTVAAIPCALLGVLGAQFGLRAESPEQPLIVPFMLEVGGFMIAFSIPMAPISWIIWQTAATRR
ncbi:MAG: hypothetical protein GC206_07795 [Alphaproteobacteria bacterium]|nr:hypothetical protein [Alphaproteobacteria bacterium]